MRTFSFIRFASCPDPEVTLMLGLIAVENTLRQVARTGGVIVTTFKSNLSIERCRFELETCGHPFLLVDVTEQSEHVQICGNDVITSDMLGLSKELVLTDEEREKDLFFKIKSRGVNSLTKEEHLFMQNRLL